MKVTTLYEFGPFRLDPLKRQLVRHGSRVHLTVKAFDILVLLVERHGEVVERDELMACVWRNVTVEEANLTQHISQLRKVLGEGPDASPYIVTHPRRGYQFVEPVRARAGTEESEPAPAPPAEDQALRPPRAAPSLWAWPGGYRLALGVAAVGALLTTVLAAEYLNTPPPTREAVQPRVAGAAIAAGGAAPGVWPTSNPDAYAYYLRGRAAWERWTTTETWAALRFFEKAVELDPEYAQAYAGIAEVYQQLAFGFASQAAGIDPGAAYGRAARAANRAMALDPSLPEANLASAVVKMRFECDWTGAERQCLRALELNPRNPHGRERYGMLLSNLGRYEEGLAQLRQAQELDPLSVRTSYSIAYALYLARRYDACVVQARETLRAAPTFPLAQQILGQCLEALGMSDQAIDAYGRSNRRSGYLGHAYATAGRLDEARDLLAMLTTGPNAGANGDEAALIYVGLGDTDRAFAALTRHMEWQTGLGVCRAGSLGAAPVWDPLRSDERFRRLLGQVKLDRAAPGGPAESSVLDVAGHQPPRSMAMP